MFQNDPCKVLTDEVRLSYVHINEAYASPSTPGATPKFSVSLLIPKTNIALVEQIKAAIRAAAQTAASSQWGGFCLPETALFSVLHDGDGVNQSGKPYGPEAKGCYVLGASSAQQPQVINGGSNLLFELFGEEKGLPARTAMGTNSCPGNIAVEIEMLVEYE